MKTRDYELQGKEVPQSLRGSKLQFPVAETLDEAVALAAGTADATELLQSAYDVWLQGRVRAQSGKEGATVESLNTFIRGAKYTKRQAGVGGGGSKPKTPRGIAQSKAASVGERFMQRCAEDETYRNRMIQQGILDEAEFTAWQTAKSQISDARSGGAQNGTQGAQSQTAPAAQAKPGREAAPQKSRR